MDFCVEYSAIWQLVGYVLYIIKVLIPIIIIVLGIMDLTKAILASKDDAVDSAVKGLLVRLAIGFAIFFIPLIISTIFAFIKDASPYIAKADACQACLLRPLSNKCNGYVSEAKTVREQNKQDASQPGKDSYEVKIAGCYYCGDHYTWTTEAGSLKCKAKIESATNEEACNKLNDGYTGFTNTDKSNEGEGGSSGNSSKPNLSDIIYLGDSIMNGICQSNSEIKTCYTCVGGGITWLTGGTSRCLNDDAISDVADKVKEKISNGGTIVIYIGTNDLGNGTEKANTAAKNLVRLYSDLLNDEWKNVNNLIITSLNPIYPNHKYFDYFVTTDEINAFNNVLAKEIKSKNNKKLKYCDLGISQEVFKDNQEYSDGLHFTSNGYQRIFKAIKKCL